MGGGWGGFTVAEVLWVSGFSQRLEYNRIQ